MHAHHIYSRFSAGWRVFLAGLASVGLMAAAGAETVRIANFGPLNSETVAVAIAMDQGLYREAGIEAELITFKGGAPAVQALASKSVDVAMGSPEHVIRLSNRGLDAHVLVPLSNITSYVLFAAKGSSVDGIAGLKGKKIGITTPGSKTDGLVRLALQRVGLDADKDASIVGIGGSANNLAAISARRVDAGMVSGVEVVLAEQQFSIVHDWRTARTASIALMALNSWTRDKPELARRFAQATLKAAELAANDKALGAQALIKLYPNIDADLLREHSEQLLAALVTRPRFTEAEFKALQDDMLAFEADLKPISYQAFNPDFLTP